MENLTHLAQQGSVKAIMQILNRQLRDAGVNTRVALGVNGTLEILCEAGHPENLDKQVIVRRIQQSLDYLAPQPFEQVHIQSCLTNDVQSLWVASLSCDDRRKLLWSEHIQIRRIPWLQRTLRGWGIDLPRVKARLVRRSSASQRMGGQRGVSPGGYRGGLLFVGAIAMGALGWFIHDWASLKSQLRQGQQPFSRSEDRAIAPSGVGMDPFAQAVRLANQAAVGGQTARSYREWIDLANRWQQAADLMMLVPVDHPRFTEAQERILSYRQNSKVALEKAQFLMPESSP